MVDYHMVELSMDMAQIVCQFAYCFRMESWLHHHQLEDVPVEKKYPYIFWYDDEDYQIAYSLSRRHTALSYQALLQENK